MNIIAFSIIFALIMIGSGLITFFAIWFALRKNNSYEKFARENGYFFDKGMIVSKAYRDYSQYTVSLGVKVPMSNAYLDKYAAYSSFPFDRGVQKLVAYIIEGSYYDIPFRAFTYQFKGNPLYGDGLGGVFAIVMIYTTNSPRGLPANTFYENNIFCHYERSNLDVDNIYPTLDYLIDLTK